MSRAWTAAQGGRWLALPAALLGWGCEIEWAGGQLTLEDPSPPPDTTVVAPTAEPAPLPLPEGSLLYLVAIERGSQARLVPIARLGDTLRPLELPAGFDAAYRARFDSTFLRPGDELELHAAGRRIGSLVLDERRSIPDTGCPSVGTASILALSGSAPPAIALAFPRGPQAVSPSRPPAAQPARRMNVASPVLAERLINDARAFLAQRVDLKAVWLPPDSAVGMAATYLIADDLRAGPPRGDAISLFFLSRWEPAQGYIPVWWELRRYSDAANKEVFAHLEWIVTPSGRVDFLRKYDATGESLVASPERVRGDPDARRLEWAEGEACRGLELLGLSRPPEAAAGG